MKKERKLLEKIGRFIKNKFREKRPVPEPVSLSAPKEVLQVPEKKTGETQIPPDPLILASLIACASITKKQLNRDSFAPICNEKFSIRGVVVADGIGQHEKVEDASRFVACSVKGQVEELLSMEDFREEQLFENCKTAFDKEFENQAGNNQFGTTLIAAFEYRSAGKNKYKIAYAGNGAAWHIKGNFNHFSPNQKVPWNCINYLNPHTVEQNGRESLSNCISVGSGNYSGPASVEFQADPEFGDIVMICTDGIVSNDQLYCSEDSFGDLWVQYPSKMTILYRHLSAFFKKGEYAETTAGIMLDNYLKELKELNLLDDDATLGIIISERALEFQKRIYYGTKDHH